MEGHPPGWGASRAEIQRERGTTAIGTRKAEPFIPLTTTYKDSIGMAQGTLRLSIRLFDEDPSKSVTSALQEQTAL
jgi:hypothetical protein